MPKGDKYGPASSDDSTYVPDVPHSNDSILSTVKSQDRQAIKVDIESYDHNVTHRQ